MVSELGCNFLQHYLFFFSALLFIIQSKWAFYWHYAYKKQFVKSSNEYQPQLD